jgi:hypothetical protein
MDDSAPSLDFEPNYTPTGRWVSRCKKLVVLMHKSKALNAEIAKAAKKNRDESRTD